MRIKKVSQVAGLVGGVSNEYSESTNDAYSCDYVNNNLIDETIYTLTRESSNISLDDQYCIVKGGICYIYAVLSISNDITYNIKLLSGLPMPIKNNYPLLTQIVGSNTYRGLRVISDGSVYSSTTFTNGESIIVSGSYKISET